MEVGEYVETNKIMKVLSEHNARAFKSAKICFNDIKIDTLSEEQYKVS